MPIPGLLAVGIGAAAVGAVGTPGATIKMFRDKKRQNDRRSAYEQFAQEYVVLVRKALKQGNQIDEDLQKMDKSTAEMDRHRAELQALLYRTEEMSKAVGEVQGTLKTVLKSALAHVIEDVHRVATAAKALAQLLDIGPPSDTQKPASGGTTHD